MQRLAVILRAVVLKGNIKTYNFTPAKTLELSKVQMDEEECLFLRMFYF